MTKTTRHFVHEDNSQTYYVHARTTVQHDMPRDLTSHYRYPRGQTRALIDHVKEVLDGAEEITRTLGIVLSARSATDSR